MNISVLQSDHDPRIIPEPLFTKRMDGLPQDLVKTQSREIGCYEDRIAKKNDRHISNTAAEVLVPFLSDWKNLNKNLVAHEIWR